MLEDTPLHINTWQNNLLLSTLRNWEWPHTHPINIICIIIYLLICVRNIEHRSSLYVSIHSFLCLIYRFYYFINGSSILIIILALHGPHPEARQFKSEWHRECHLFISLPFIKRNKNTQHLEGFRSGPTPEYERHLSQLVQHFAMNIWVPFVFVKCWNSWNMLTTCKNDAKRFSA